MENKSERNQVENGLPISFFSWLTYLIGYSDSDTLYAGREQKLDGLFRVDDGNLSIEESII